MYTDDYVKLQHLIEHDVVIPASRYPPKATMDLEKEIPASVYFFSYLYGIPENEIEDRYFKALERGKLIAKNRQDTALWRQGYFDKEVKRVKDLYKKKYAEGDLKDEYHIKDWNTHFDGFPLTPK